MSGISKFIKSSVSAVALTALLIPASAFAQDDDQIIITARKQQETILEVPLAITAFDEAAIEDLGLQSIEDIQLYTPGFVFEAFATLPGRFDQSPRFRGIDIDTGNPLRQTASIFVDGLFVANGASGINLSDIQRVEVVKGPQSALFGRNTYGGAVNYISKTPGDRFAADVSVSAATRNDYEMSVGLEAPIIQNVLSARVSGFYRDKEGHYDNVADPGSKLGSQETMSLTGTLFFTPNDRIDAKFRVNHFTNDDGAPAVIQIGQAFFNCGPFQDQDPNGGAVPIDRAFCGTLPIDVPELTGQNTGLAGSFPNLDGFFRLNDRDIGDIGFERKSTSYSADINFDLTDNITLTSLTGYSEDEAQLIVDADEGPIDNWLSANDRTFEVFSQELRLAGTSLDNKLNWIIGGNYFDFDFKSVGGFFIGAENIFSGGQRGYLFGNSMPNIGQESAKTLGAFGSLTYQISDQFSISAEGRYQEDKVFEDGNIEDTVDGDRATFTNFLPRVILDYTPSANTLLYASYSEGNLPGGFNGSVIALNETDRASLLATDPLATNTFDEEQLNNYELGWKQSFADGRATLQTAAFFMERSGQTFRTSTVIPSSGNQVDYFVNRGSSDIKGVEAEGNIQLNEHFNLGATFAYVDAEFDVVSDGVYNEYFGSFDSSGQKAPRFPKLSGSVSALLEHDLGTGLPLYLRADAGLVGERFPDSSNLQNSAAGQIVNLRAGMKQDNYTIELFARNVTGEDIPTGLNRFRDLSLPGFGAFSIFSYRQGLRDKSQFGVRATYSFD